MKRAFLLPLLIVLACGSHETSAPGPVGTGIDLRSHLDTAVAKRAPADAKATRYEATFDIHGAATKIVWYAFTDESTTGAPTKNKYLLSAHWEVVKPAPSVTITPEGSMNPENIGSTFFVVESIPIKVRWNDTSSSTTHFGEVVIKIAADGTSLKL
jgi:hypothetical protein